jgi:hypothetical protein
LDISRKIKPSIPVVGDNGIPLKHEIEFEISLLNEQIGKRRILDFIRIDNVSRSGAELLFVQAGGNPKGDLEYGDGFVIEKNVKGE